MLTMVRLAPVSSKSMAGFPFTLACTRMKACAVLKGTVATCGRARFGSGTSKRITRTSERENLPVILLCANKHRALQRPADKRTGLLREPAANPRLANGFKLQLPRAPARIPG